MFIIIFHGHERLTSLRIPFPPPHPRNTFPNISPTTPDCDIALLIEVERSNSSTDSLSVHWCHKIRYSFALGHLSQSMASQSCYYSVTKITIH